MVRVCAMRVGRKFFVRENDAEINAHTVKGEFSASGYHPTRRLSLCLSCLSLKIFSILFFDLLSKNFNNNNNNSNRCVCITKENY